MGRFSAAYTASFLSPPGRISGRNGLLSHLPATTAAVSLVSGPPHPRPALLDPTDPIPLRCRLQTRALLPPPYSHRKPPSPVLRLPELLPAPSWVFCPHGSGRPPSARGLYLPAGGTAFKGEGVPSSVGAGASSALHPGCAHGPGTGFTVKQGCPQDHGGEGCMSQAEQCAGCARALTRGDGELAAISPPKREDCPGPPLEFLDPKPLLCFPSCDAVSNTPPFTGKPQPQDAVGRPLFQSLPGLQASAPGPAEPACSSSPAWPRPALGISLSLCLSQGV